MNVRTNAPQFSRSFAAMSLLFPLTFEAGAEPNRVWTRGGLPPGRRATVPGHQERAWMGYATPRDQLLVFKQG